MRFGTYHVFQCPPGQAPARVMAEEIARAELAETLGFDDVWVPEQHFSPYCLCGDALLMAGHLAARTRRVQIGTAVVNLTFTHPLRFVERVALLDHATGGRVEVGVGRGYQFPQYGVFGVPIDETRARFDEALDIVLQAWGGEELTHEGRFFRLPRVQVWPVPVRAPGDVLLHAVNSLESMIRAIARGLPALMARPLSPFSEQVEEFRRYRNALVAAGGCRTTPTTTGSITSSCSTSPPPVATRLPLCTLRASNACSSGWAGEAWRTICCSAPCGSSPRRSCRTSGERPCRRRRATRRAILSSPVVELDGAVAAGESDVLAVGVGGRWSVA
jgi:hypothetical protein